MRKSKSQVGYQDYYKMSSGDGKYLRLEYNSAMSLAEIASRRIRIARKDSGLTQAELADHLGLTRDAVSKMETGVSTPTLRTLEQLPGILNRSVEWFLGLDREMTPDEARLLELYRALPPEGPFREQATQFLSTWLDSSLAWLESERRRLDTDED